MNERIGKWVHAGVISGILVLDCAAQYHLPLNDLEVVTAIDGGDIVALGSAPDSVETIFANDEGVFFRVKDGVVADDPWLDLSAGVFDPESGADQRGLSDFVFSPQQGESNTLYVTYTPVSNERALLVSRITVNNGENPIEEVLLEIPFATGLEPYPNFGGDLEFGPDGYLYIATGDGYLQTNTLAGLPAPQALDKYEGKILRIDVSAPADEHPYGIPDDNPFVNEENSLPEIWAFGFQNPRIAFDTEAIRLFVIDDALYKSSGAQEEISVIGIAASRGQNFGWPFFRGSSPYYKQGTMPRPMDTVMPLLDSVPLFNPTRGVVKDGVLHFATANRSYGWTIYFAAEPHFDRDYAMGRATDRCCENGFSTVGRGANGDALYVSEEGTIYRAIPATSISPPNIDVSTTDNGTMVSGWGTLQLSPSPFYLAVYYTTDGSEPTTESMAWDWENPPLLVDNMTVNAISYHPSTGPSKVATRQINLKAAPVDFDRKNTNPNIEAAVILSTLTPDAEIYYTLDGSTPRLESPLYDPENPPIVSGPTEVMVRAAAYRPDLGFSRLKSWPYGFGLAEAKLAGDVTTVLPGQEVALIGTNGARIHYTLDGSEPTEASPVYSKPIPGKDAGWVRTLSVLEGYPSQREDALGVRLRNPRNASTLLIAGGGNIEDSGIEIPAFDARFRGPTSLAETPDGTLYAISGGREILYSLSPEGMATIWAFDNKSNYQFNDVAPLPDGDLVLAMQQYPGLMIASRSEFGAIEDSPEIIAIENPRHVTAGSDGVIYVANGETIRTISSDGTVTTFGGDGTTFFEGTPVDLADIKFRELRDIAAAPDGGLYVGEGARLLKIVNNRVGLVAGSDEVVGHIDGKGSAAALPALDNITVDRFGNCYVPARDANGEPHSLRQISPAGEVTTIYLQADPAINERAAAALVRQDGTVAVSIGNELYAATLDDWDGDGIIDAEENPPLTPGEDDRFIDSDQDGMSNVAEHLFGTSPSEAASLLPGFSAKRQPDGALAVLIPTENGMVYDIEASHDLKSWRLIDSVVGGSYQRTLHLVYPEIWRKIEHYRAVQK